MRTLRLSIIACLILGSFGAGPTTRSGSKISKPLQPEYYEVDGIVQSIPPSCLPPDGAVVWDNDSLIRTDRWVGSKVIRGRLICEMPTPVIDVRITKTCVQMVVAAAVRPGKLVFDGRDVSLVCQYPLSTADEFRDIRPGQYVKVVGYIQSCAISGADRQPPDGIPSRIGVVLTGGGFTKAQGPPR